jgi:hypothetical protein
MPATLVPVPATHALVPVPATLVPATLVPDTHAPDTHALLYDFVQDYDCPLLNIGEQKGDWGYINFITEKDLGQSAVMKGHDCIGRAFLVLKAEFILAEGPPIPVFATLYQKYVNNKTIWQCFNYPGMEFLYTSYLGDGYPIDDMQIALFVALLEEKRIDLTPGEEGLFPRQADAPIVALRLRTDRRSSFIT